jgi:quercetin dioxygenase-like cupin family protein
MHEHPANVIVSLTDVHVKVTLTGGKTEERTRKAGSAVYRTAEKHAIENLSDKDYESIIIELKATSAASKPAIQLALDPAKVDPKHCKVEFENDQVRVLRWTEGPHSKVPMHEHPAYVSVWLTDGHSRYALPDGKTREVQWKAGQVAWSAAVKHASENLTDKPTELVQIELKAKPAASKPAA